MLQLYTNYIQSELHMTDWDIHYCKWRNFYKLQHFNIYILCCLFVHCEMMVSVNACKIYQCEIRKFDFWFLLLSQI